MIRRESKRRGGRGRHRTSAVAFSALAIIAASTGAVIAPAAGAGDQAKKSAAPKQTVKKSMWGSADRWRTAARSSRS